MSGHGTELAYQQHHAENTPPCPDCLLAHTWRTSWSRFRIGIQRTPRRCQDCSSVFLGHTCHLRGTR